MEIYIYGLILAGYLVLGFISRKDGGISTEKMAEYIYRKGKELGKKGGGARLFEDDTVRRDLALLCPFDRTQREADRFYVGRIRIVLLILLAGDILAAASYAAAEGSLLLRDGSRLIREEIGGEDRNTELEAYMIPGKGEASDDAEEKVYQGSYQLEVRARKYSDEQLQEMAEKVFDILPGMIAGENSDLSNVRSSLSLPEQVEGYPFQIQWESSSYALIDSDGTVGNLKMEESAGEDVTLSAILIYDNGTAGGFRLKKDYMVTVKPPEMTAQEKFKEEIRKAILEADEDSSAKEELPLPTEMENKRLQWEEKPSDQGNAILLFAGITAILTAASMGSRLHEQVKRRERQMQLDYPQIISKFVLYLGAGLSIRSTFLKLGEDYQQEKDKGKAARGAYEEILLVCRELSNGVPETEAYARFGQRCRSKQYTKLSALLVQNLRKGNQELLSVMQQEAQAAFDERRNMARKLGEEAETKLLLPMVMMLAITMLIIIIPAYYSFAA